ncbi:hypothetical protein C8Q77DRAFT_1217561 [Trametes polyzona]|nr:hypothetical protein C8Q77DRAFT_1217561 [Trametes polyzona]
MAGKATAAELKRRGNEEFKAGRFSRCAPAAEKADPNDPVYPSNLSAALFEVGDYSGCVVAILRSWRLLRPQRDSKGDLVARLSSRLAKTLCFAARSDPEAIRTTKLYASDIAKLKEYSLKATSGASPVDIGELHRWWNEWEASKTGLGCFEEKKSKCLAALSRLPLFMKPLDDAKEYYTIGHDPLIDLTAGWSPECTTGNYRLDFGFMSLEDLSEVSFLFGGAGDGRHALASIVGLHAAYKRLPRAKQAVLRTHLTLLDIHPTAIARDLCMLMLLDDLNHTTNHTVRAEIKATLMYSFCGAVMPGYCYERLMSLMDSLSERLVHPNQSLPSWLHVDGNAIQPVLQALRYWKSARKSTIKMLAHHRHYSMRSQLMYARRPGGGGQPGLSDPQRQMRARYVEQRNLMKTMLRELSDDALLQLPWMLPGVTIPQARTFVNANMGTLVDTLQRMVVGEKIPVDEEEWYKLTKVFFPPSELLERHPLFREAGTRLALGRNVDRVMSRKINAHIENDWKPNITLFAASFDDSRHFPDGDGYQSMSVDAFEPVGQVEDFVKRENVEKRRNDGDADELAYDTFDVFFEEIAAALRDLEGHITLELIVGGLSEELAKMRFSGDTTRPAAFPRTYTRMWLSNVPDYTHGPMNMAIYIVPNLQEHKQSGVACNCLLNTCSFRNDEEYFYTYTHLLSRDAPRYLGCRVIYFKPVMEVLVLGPLALPRPLSELASRDELTVWLTRVLFNTLIPGRSAMPPQNVRLPNNLHSFFGLLIHLHGVGYPAHWLADFLSRVLSGSMVSDTAPYAGVWPIPVDDAHRRVPTRRVRTDPWLVDFETAIATAYHAIPFPLTGVLPADFSRDPDDIRVWEAKVSSPLPLSTIAWDPRLGYGNPFEPVTRLLFFKPAETTAEALVQKLHDVFEGATSPPPNAFFVLTSQDLVQYYARVRFRLSARRVQRMREEKWCMVAYRQDSGQLATRPSFASDWTAVRAAE